VKWQGSGSGKYDGGIGCMWHAFCVRALANREYPEVNHPEVTREKGGKSVTESPTAVRIHIWI